MARFLLLWVHGPWIAASLMVILALRLLMAEDFSLHGHGWGLLGSASICFSIGCVCIVSWVLAHLDRRTAAADHPQEQLLLL